MRHLLLATCLALLPLQSGCGYAPAFMLLGDYYSDGGDSREAKQAHFDEHVRQYDRPWNDR
jgi:hypothetical protein